MRLFISYARIDILVCKLIVKELATHEVWFDRDLFAGENWWETIQNRIQWCEGFVYLLSSESIASEYCRREYDIARKTDKTIFPVLIRRAEIPADLGVLQYADISNGIEDTGKLLLSIHNAERKQLQAQVAALTSAQRKVISEDKPTLPIDPVQGLNLAVEAMGKSDYDRAVFLFKQLLDESNLPRATQKLAESMLAQAEVGLERQKYEHKAAFEYNPIAIMVKNPATREAGCHFFADFQNEFPNYDPEHLSSICAAHSQVVHNISDILPLPFEWCSIPAGKVDIMGVGEFDIPAFQIAKYPVTVEQYETFMKEGGYENETFWTKEGWETRKNGWDYIDGRWQPSRTPWTKPRFWGNKDYVDFFQPNHPIIGISWYEAIAFCNWLTGKVSDISVTLPTEQQWQRAAQGDDKRTYAWGNKWNCERCNNSVHPCDNKSTTPVTKYSLGASPYGVIDMTGNVAEWTLSEDDRADSSEVDNITHILRGGSWHDSYIVNLHVSHRAKYYAYARNYTLGFRIILAGK